MMLWYGSEMSGWTYAGMAIGMILFWTALIVGGVVLLQQVFATKMQSPSTGATPIPHSAFWQRSSRVEISTKPIPAAERIIAGGRRSHPAGRSLP